MSKPGSHVCARENLPAEGRSVTGDLITGYTASGVKLAGRQYRLLYGTREVVIVLLTEYGYRCGRMPRDSGGGLSRSSDEPSVMEAERRA